MYMYIWQIKTLFETIFKLFPAVSTSVNNLYMASSITLGMLQKIQTFCTVSKYSFGIVHILQYLPFVQFETNVNLNCYELFRTLNLSPFML